MEKRERLDKILAHAGYGTRSEVKKMLKSGNVTVNGIPAKDGGIRVHPKEDEIRVGGTRVDYRPFIYLMMNKPQGVISATEDAEQTTVVDLLDESYLRFSPFPVGRLDKDTEGLLLLTNDGKLAHRLLSPKKNVPKTYYAEIEGRVDERDVEQFSRGVVLDDGYTTLPAELNILSAEPDRSRIELTIREGKFHQVKRMFQAVGKKVLFLKRISMGPLELDKGLLPGKYRELTEEEISRLQEYQ